MLHDRMGLLREIQELEALLAAIAQERARIAAETAAMGSSVRQFQTALVAAGVGHHNSLRGGSGPMGVGPDPPLHRAAVIVNAELHAHVDIAGVTDEEALQRLVRALEVSETELTHLCHVHAADASGSAPAVASGSRTDSTGDHETLRLRKEAASLRAELDALRGAGKGSPAGVR